jgi:predicted nucleic acid-binding protein
VISDWVVTEVSSALALKLRTGALQLPHRAAALAAFTGLVATSLAVLPVLATHFRTAAHFVDRHDLGLRAGDALHLAVAADHGATLVTLDARLQAAALALGVPIQDV